MSNIAISQAVGAYNVTVEYEDDFDGLSPRDWDNVSTILCYLERYSVGDKHPRIFASIREIQEYVDALEDIVAIKLVYAYIHGGITISTGPYSDPWDSGIIGYVYVTKERMKYMGIPENEMTAENANKIIDEEIKTYDDYLCGEVFAYIIDGPGFHESCTGFIGDYKDCFNEAMSVLNHHLEYLKKCRESITEDMMDATKTECSKFVCPECGKVFDDWNACREHLLEYHPDYITKPLNM